MSLREVNNNSKNGFLNSYCNGVIDTGLSYTIQYRPMSKVVES